MPGPVQQASPSQQGAENLKELRAHELAGQGCELAGVRYREVRIASRWGCNRWGCKRRLRRNVSAGGEFPLASSLGPLGPTAPRCRTWLQVVAERPHATDLFQLIEWGSDDGEPAVDEDILADDAVVLGV